MSDLIADNVIFRNIYAFVVDGLGAEWAWLAWLTAGFVLVMLVVNAVMALAMAYTWVERRLLGRLTNRIGPNRAGPSGTLQPLADAIKLLTKEDIVPAAGDRLIFNIAPVLMLASVLLAAAVIPFGAGAFVTDLNVGILYLAAVSSLASIAVLMAGYASANKFSTFGSMRAVAVLVSYEIPLVMALLGVTVLAGTMSLVGVVEGQHAPYLLVAPLGAFVFVTAISAELNRTPFDVTEGESEIVAGYLTEYSGMKFGVFYLAEFAALVVAGGVFAALFLQGWRWEVLPSYLWFLIKVGVFAIAATWVRATLPRLRPDQILAFAWKFLFPVGLVNVAALSVERLWLGGADGALTASDLWLMAAINWPLALLAVAVMGRVARIREQAPRVAAMGVR